MSNPSVVLARDLVQQEIAPWLGHLGFRRSGRVFRRGGPACDHELAFGGRVHRPGPGYWVTVGAGCRFPEVEWLRAAGRGGSSGTVGANIGVLGPRKTYQEWLLVRPERIPHVGAEIRAAIERIALPFFERFATLESVRGELETHLHS